MRAIRVVLIEDSAEDAELMVSHLRRAGFEPEVRLVLTEEELVASLDPPPDLVIADYTLPRLDAPRALAVVQARGADVPFVVVTGSVGEERAVALMRLGAADCLLKDRLERLGPAVTRAIDDRDARAAKRAAEAEVERLMARLESENDYLREEIRHHHDHEHLIGQSLVMQRVQADIDAVAPTDASVLLTGETGTGKELVARAVHARSRRRERPLVKVDCAALSPQLIESELFGHERGAFTGAVGRTTGRFELAHGGTLFLDEIGELPAGVQAKLLRVLQDGELERVGSTQTLRVDVRIIAATNRDLEAEARSGAFRADLFYRLHVFPIPLPPLRERGGDVARLAREFLRRAARRHGRAVADLSAEALRAIEAYPWPGNVRELENVIERAVITCRQSVLGVEGLLGIGDRAAPAPAPAAEGEPATIEAVERAHIERVLERAGWRVEGPGGAAELLGKSPSTLRSRMKKLGIARRLGPARKQPS